MNNLPDIDSLINCFKEALKDGTLTYREGSKIMPILEHRRRFIEVNEILDKAFETNKGK